MKLTVSNGISVVVAKDIYGEKRTLLVNGLFDRGEYFVALNTPLPTEKIRVCVENLEFTMDPDPSKILEYLDSIIPGEPPVCDTREPPKHRRRFVRRNRQRKNIKRHKDIYTTSIYEDIHTDSDSDSDSYYSDDDRE